MTAHLRRLSEEQPHVFPLRDANNRPWHERKPSVDLQPLRHQSVFERLQIERPAGEPTFAQGFAWLLIAVVLFALLWAVLPA